DDDYNTPRVVGPVTHRAFCSFLGTLLTISCNALSDMSLPYLYSAIRFNYWVLLQDDIKAALAAFKGYIGDKNNKN
ncbi:hypothetical protein ACLBSM_32710, partial [Klebsiella pneumoniae]